jgi:hypothetical protein
MVRSPKANFSNGVGGNLANRYQARPFFKDDDGTCPWALGTLAGPIFPIFLTFSQYRVCYAAWNESIRLVTRRTSDQARKGKNCQRETYLPGSASCSAFAERPRKSGGHGPGRNCCRHRRAVAPSAPCVRPRSSVAAHGRPLDQTRAIGACWGCGRRLLPQDEGEGRDVPNKGRPNETRIARRPGTRQDNQDPGPKGPFTPRVI